MRICVTLRQVFFPNLAYAPDPESLLEGITFLKHLSCCRVLKKNPEKSICSFPELETLCTGQRNNQEKRVTFGFTATPRTLCFANLLRGNRPVSALSLLYTVKPGSLPANVHCAPRNPLVAIFCATEIQSRGKSLFVDRFCLVCEIFLKVFSV